MDLASDGEAPFTWDILTSIEVVCVFICYVVQCWGVHMWGGVDSELCYLSWSDGVSCKTWSQMCGSWYLPKFLLSEGILNCMYFASFIFLVTSCDFLSTMVKQLGLTVCPVEFAAEEPNQEGALPFLDTLVSPGPNNRLVTTVYRKPTHAGQYLHWDSHHFITAKNSVYNTLAFRAKVVCTSQHTLQMEINHINEDLQVCNFIPRALNSLHTKRNWKHNSHNGCTNHSTTNKWTTTTVDPTIKHFYCGALHPWIGGKV